MGKANPYILAVFYGDLRVDNSGLGKILGES